MTLERSHCTGRGEVVWKIVCFLGISDFCSGLAESGESAVSVSMLVSCLDRGLP